MKLSDDEIREGLLEFVSTTFMVDKSEIELDKSMIDMGIIDSMGLIEIVSYLENHYEFKVTEEQMNRDNFGSVLKIVEFVKRMVYANVA